MGQVQSLERQDGGVRLTITAPATLMGDAREGDSMSVSGVCLTMLEPDAASFAADVSVETVDRTTLGSYAAGRKVNLEPALRAADRLGGHLVSGHVDGRARLVAHETVGSDERYDFAVPEGLERYIARKGSVCLDGVSLTVNRVRDGQFSVNLIPHTLDVTTLGSLQIGGHVNLEVDMIARYLERLIAYGGEQA